MKTITIKLAAPLQSYGNEATFSQRTSDAYPSKSAIVGMIAAALGYERTDSRIQELTKLSFGVRIDQPGQMFTEFQTVEWKPGTRKLTYRDYLQDAIFVVAIGSEDAAEINLIINALRHPHFQLYLGRKSNPPAGPLMISEFDGKTPLEVLQRIDWQAADWYQKKTKQREAPIVLDANLKTDARNRVVRDQVVSFDQRNRKYTFRTVADATVKLFVAGSVQSIETSHDVWNTI
jgi:CRISPR system Cascade subunit CasD